MSPLTEKQTESVPGSSRPRVPTNPILPYCSPTRCF